MLHLWIVNDFVDGVDGCVWNVVTAQSLDPISQIAARESLIEFGIQRVIVVYSCLANPKSLV